MKSFKNGYQVINSTDIYKRNASGVINKSLGCGSSLPNSYQSGLGLGPFVIFGFFAIPISTTIGAGIKTAIDMRERVPLSEKDVNEMLSILNQLNTEATSDIVDQIASSICEFKANSNSCKKLQADLNEIKEDDKRYIKQVETEKKNDILIRAKTQERKMLCKILKNIETSFFKIQSCTPTYKFTEKEIAEINETILKESAKRTGPSTDQKVKCIIAYLTAPHNAGKKLQHHILAKLRECPSNTVTALEVIVI